MAKKVDTNALIILALLFVSTATELINFLFVHLKKEKMYMYFVFNVFEISLITLYFLSVFKYYRLLRFIFLVLIYIAMEVLNMALFQPILSLNTNFIIAESFIIIAMSLFAVYKILIDDTIEKIWLYPHFWLWTFIFVYFSTTFFYWSFIKMLYKSHSVFFEVAEYFSLSINIIVYTGIGLTFLFYPKMSRK